MKRFLVAGGLAAAIAVPAGVAVAATSSSSPSPAPATSPSAGPGCGSGNSYGYGYGYGRMMGGTGDPTGCPYADSADMQQRRERCLQLMQGFGRGPASVPSPSVTPTPGS